MNEELDITLIRILLVGMLNRDERVFRAALKAHGIKSRISVCKTAQAAIERLKRGPIFHIIVAEDRLPESSGLDMFRSVEAVSESPVLLLIESGEVERTKEVIRAGVDRFLLKDTAGMYFEILPTLISAAVRRNQAEITNRKREVSLQENFMLYRTLFEVAGDAIFLLKGDRVVECNSQALSLFGTARDALINKTPYDLSPTTQPDGKSSKQKALALIKEALEEGLCRFEWLLSRGDGTTFNAEVTLTSATLGDERYLLAIMRDITERKRATEARRKVEATFGALLNAPTDTAMLVELDGTIVSCNEATARSLGTKVETLVGKNIFAFFSPEIGRGRKAQAEKVVQMKRAVRFEDQRQGRWYDNHLYPVYDEDGEVVRIAIFARDITTRRTAEEKLQILSSAIEQSTNSIIIVNPDGVVEYANPTSTSLYRMKPEDIIGMNWRTFLSQHSTLRENYSAIRQTVLERGEIWKGEICDRAVDGGLVWRESTFVPIKGEAGEITHVVYISEDITERKLAEQNLALTYHGIDQAQIGLFQVDDAGMIYYANQHACASLGYSDEELLRMHIWEIDPNLSERRWGEHRKSTREIGATTFETIHRRKDGTEFPVEVTINFVTLGDRSISISIAKDITERKRAERELRYNFEFESLVAAISTRLLSITRETFDSEIDQALEELGEFLQVQRCGLHQRSKDGNSIVLTHEWCAAGVSSLKAVLSGFQDGDVPWILNEMRAGEILHVRSKADLPAEVEDEMGFLFALDVRSFIEIPMAFEGLVIGGLGLSYDLDYTEIPEAALPLLLTLGEIFASAIVRNKSENALRRERDLVRNIMETSPIGITVADRDGQITFANTSVQQVLGLQKDVITQRTFNAPAWRITDFEGGSFPDEQLPFMRVKNSGKTVYDIRHAIEWPDGRRVLLSINAAPLFDQTGNFEGMVATVEDITERVQTNTDLRTAKEFAENLLETANVIVLTLDRTATITNFNHFAERLTGYSKEEVIGKNWFEMFIPQRDRQSIPRVFAHVLENIPEGAQHENPIVTKNGEERLISWSNNVLRNDADRIDGVLSIGMDITEGKWAEARDRTILSTAMDGLIVVDVDGDVLEVNDAYCQMVGYRQAELLSLNVRDLEAIEKSDDVANHLHQITQAGHQRFETKHKRKDGSFIDLEVSANYLEQDGGQIFTFLRDISERKRAEEELRQSEEKYRNLVDNMGEVVYSVDTEGVITYVSPVIESITGYSPEEITAHTFHEFFHPADVPRLIDNFRDLLSGEPKTGEYRMITKSGETRWISTLSQPFLDEGRIIGVSGTLSDVTQRKLAENAVRRNAERLQIMHDIDRSILQAESSEAIARGTLNRLRELIPCQRASVSLLDFHDKQTMQILVAVPSGSEFSTGREYPVPWMNAAALDRRGQHDSVYVEDIRSISQPSYIQKTLAAEGIRSFVNVPMILQDEYIGSLNLGAAEPGFFTTDYLEVAKEVAASLAISIHQARLLEMEQRRRQELEIFEGVSIALRDAENQEDLLSILLEQAMTLFHADASAIWLPQSCALEQLLTQQSVKRKAFSSAMQVHKTDLQTVLNVDKPVFLTELPFQIEGVTSMMVAPMRARNIPDRMLVLYYATRSDFSEDERRMLTAITDMVVIALGRLTILESLERQVVERTREITTLYELAEISASSEDLNTSLARSLEKVLETAGCETGTIHLLNDERSYFELAVQRGLSPEMEREFLTVSPDDAFWGQIIKKDEPLLLLNLRNDAHANPVLLRSSLQCFVGAPINVGEETVGIIALFHLSEHDLSLDEIGLLNLVSDQIGLAVERTRLREQAEHAVISRERQRLARELHDAVTQSLYSLSFIAKASRNFAREGQWDRVEEHLLTVQETAQQALKEMRLLVYELMPASLEKQGLVDLLRQRLDFVERRSGVDTEIIVEGDFDFSPRIQVGMYRIAEETLNNTLKHASATEVVLRLNSSGNRVEMEIEDNGKGFDPAHTTGGMGLANMRERAENLNGELTIDSEANRGTKIRLVIHEVQT